MKRAKLERILYRPTVRQSRGEPVFVRMRNPLAGQPQIRQELFM